MGEYFLTCELGLLMYFPNKFLQFFVGLMVSFFFILFYHKHTTPK